MSPHVSTNKKTKPRFPKNIGKPRPVSKDRGKKFRGDKLFKKLVSILDKLEAREKKTRRNLSIGTGLAIIDPIIGVPASIPGLLGLVNDVTTRHRLRQKLVEYPLASRLLAKKFEGTKHGRFFAEIADVAEKGGFEV